MRYLLTIWVIIVLIGLLIVSLINLDEYGANGLILAGISAFALYRCFKFVFAEADPEETKENRPARGRITDPLEYIILGDIVCDVNPDEGDDFNR